MIAFSRLALLAALLSSWAPAQQLLGSKVVAPTWGPWLQGTAITLSGAAAAPATVIACYASPTLASAFAGDADYLAALRRRHREQGLVVVAVAGEAKPAGLEHWVDCPVVVDDAQVTATAWQLDRSLGHVVVVDRDGVVTFVGTPESGLADAIAATLAGDPQIAAEARAAALRRELAAGFDDVTGPAAMATLVPSLQRAPHDGLLLGMGYLALATKSGDADGAARWLREAVSRLADEPRPLAAFADLALRGDPRRPGLVTVLRAPLQAAAVAAPRDPRVQLTWLRLLVAAGDAREVARQAVRARKVALVDAEHCLDFVTILTRDQTPAVHLDLCRIVLQRAAELGAPGRLLAAARFGVARRCAGDEPAGKAVLDDYLKDTDMRASLNNDCWYLMTELATVGRYDVFAAALAERMLEQRSGMDAFEFDTAALAMFLCGRIEEAVDLQQSAIEKSGGGNAGYEERLRRYKADLAPAPR